MPVENYVSAQLTEGYRPRPTEDHGKLRVQYFRAIANNVVGDAGSTYDLCELPPGAVRVLPGLSRYSITAQGAARTLNLGHRAYEVGVDVTDAQTLNAFINAADVSAAVNGAALGTGIKYDMYSKSGVTITAQVNGGTTPGTTVIEGYVTYVYE